MDFLELMKKRRSVRAYKKELIPQELVEKILEAIRLAPSAGNIQSFRIKVIEDEQTKKKLVNASFGQMFILEAPIIIGFFAFPEESKLKYGERGARLYSLQDATIALYTASLMADELGLGSCWIGAFDDAKVCEAFGVDLKRFIPVGFLPIGYPNEEPKDKVRKEIDELLL